MTLRHPLQNVVTPIAENCFRWSPFPFDQNSCKSHQGLGPDLNQKYVVDLLYISTSLCCGLWANDKEIQKRVNETGENWSKRHYFVIATVTSFVATKETKIGVSNSSTLKKAK